MMFTLRRLHVLRARARQRLPWISCSLVELTSAKASGTSDCSRQFTSSRSDGDHDGNDRTTDFGYRQVPLKEKQTLVSSVFSSVASNYDLMNDVMSLRIHRLWKSTFVNEMSPMGEMRILDCAGGTGDIAYRIADYVHQNNGWKSSDAGITVCDINKDMLAVGQQRARNLIDPSRIQFLQGDAQHLPFEDASFDIYAISFGMRNVPEPNVALREALRVLKPGGRFMMLEFGKVQIDAIRRFYDAWSFGVIPMVGRYIAQDEAAYRYLVESIRQFPAQSQFLHMLRDTGFIVETATNYSFGIAACYSAFKVS